METVRLLEAYVSIFVIPAPHCVRDKLQRESSFFALDPCFRRGDIVDFAEEFKKSFLGNSVTVARLTLDQLVQVRILVPQYTLPVNVSRIKEGKNMKFFITIFRDEDGVFIAECPSIPGCVSQGKTEQEAESNIREAIKECLEVRAEKGMPLTVSTRQVEVNV